MTEDKKNIIKLDLSKIYSPNFFKNYEKKYKDLSWERETIKTKKNLKIQTLKMKIKSLLGRSRYRSPDYVKNYYKVWKKFNMTQINPQKHNKYVPTNLNGKIFNINFYGLNRVILLRMIQLIKILKPKTVLEVGSGVGFYPLLLSSIFPNISFTGLELSKEGVEASKEFQEFNRLPKHWQEFIPLEKVHLSAFKKAKFMNGSSLDIPSKTNNFDLVFTCLALEQMENIKEKAISEIVRVTKKNVSFIEPFNNLNNTSPQKEYIYLMNYFKSTFEDMNKFNLRELFRDGNNYPQKIHIKVGHYVGEKI